jgi:Protein of unknown function (DUF4238)
VKEHGPPQKQHYLPAIYLRQFSVDGRDSSRKSKIWRLNENAHKAVPVESQCHDRFFYSASDSLAAEKIFQAFEDMYARLVELIWKGRQNRTDKEYFGLILMIISLHLRNPAYEVRQHVARIDAYKLLEQQVVYHVLLPGSEEALKPEQLLAVVKRRWRVRLLSRLLGPTLVTSDNPSVWYTVNDSGDPHFMVLPVTPECCAIAFNRDAITVEGSVLTKTDVEVLNQTQAKSMLKALYSSVAFCEQDQSAATGMWKARTPPTGFIDGTIWSMNILQYTGSLSFIRTLVA